MAKPPKVRVVIFATFLAALSIPLIGDSASKKIANLGFSSVLDILDSDYYDALYIFFIFTAFPR